MTTHCDGGVTRKSPVPGRGRGGGDDDGGGLIRGLTGRLMKSFLGSFGGLSSLILSRCFGMWYGVGMCRKSFGALSAGLPRLNGGGGRGGRWRGEGTGMCWRRRKTRRQRFQLLMLRLLLLGGPVNDCD